MSAKKENIIRVYVVYVAMLLFAFLILFQIVKVQFVDGGELKKEAEGRTLVMKSIKAPRGNIFADNEPRTTLALSVPRYDIYMDLMTVKQELFDEGIEALSDSLSVVFTHKTKSEWLATLRHEREVDSNQYFRIKSKIKNAELRRLKTFPIFKKGKNRGGFIVVRDMKRVKPYDLLAYRTIGRYKAIEEDSARGIRADTIAIGLEGAYNDFLEGQDGEMLMKKIRGNEWKPVSSDLSLEPIPGADVYTSIDVNIQDVAESALMKQLQEQNAEKGCVVLMEVETGYIKAIANLSKGQNEGEFYELHNMAVGRVSEPGSTLKLATLLTMLEDNKIRLTDSVDMPGVYRIYDRVLHDSRPGGYGRNTIQYAFEKSSNVFAKLVDDNYRTNPQAYIDGLVRLGLRKPLGLEIKGEGVPKLKNATAKEGFSGVTLSSMAIGYEVEITPMQTLALYNAVANGGRLMKPQFVKEIRRGGKVLKEFEPVELKAKIASEQNIALVRKALEGVVERGTAKNIRALGFKIAGKTGTAKKLDENGRYGNKYQASFCGYFPAENPKYSCVVVIQGPTKNIYGAVVSGTVFKEIADKVYASGLDNFNEVAEESTKMPYSKNGLRSDLKEVMERIGVEVDDQSGDYDWVKTITGERSVNFYTKSVAKNVMPEVKGMGLGDALYLLESKGLSVEVKGSGVVKAQSIEVGREVVSGQLVTLELVE
ncbi:MAG: transpeptidase family protein [Flavobacteriales bacterium]|jgi:cell division protein FtsI (penicillin-binding protein 3)|nr:transpeptidase family protein [Flavobacteriales bacterium]